jgi:GT2 family glycosyltransferase
VQRQHLYDVRLARSIAHKLRRGSITKQSSKTVVWRVVSAIITIVLSKGPKMSKCIAVLIACHNRKPKTLKCLNILLKQDLASGLSLDIYLVDDGSTDGTGEAVRVAFPEVHVIPADGSLFWSRGMHVAWQHASRADADFYLWLNDDTYLLSGCIQQLLVTWGQYAARGKESCIVVASCRDPDTGEHSYGGEICAGRPDCFTPVLPDPASAKECHTFNGNCVLVPKATFKILGLMRTFQHATSDTDYGLFAIRHNLPVVIAPGYLAECNVNHTFKCFRTSWRNRALPRGERWRLLVARKGLPPMDFWENSLGPRRFSGALVLAEAIPSRASGPLSNTPFNHRWALR